jgi:hypothetical protein
VISSSSTTQDDSPGCRVPGFCHGVCEGISVRISFTVKGRLRPQASRNPGFRTGAFFYLVLTSGHWTFQDGGNFVRPQNFQNCTKSEQSQPLARQMTSLR